VGLFGEGGAAFDLLDESDGVYLEDANSSVELQPGRMLLAFIVPKQLMVKGLRVYPSEGDPFVILWDKVAKHTNGVANLRYYGIGEIKVEGGRQMVTLDVSLANNGTENLLVVPENFSLLDQWGWRYYPEPSFQGIDLPPKNIVRLGVTFSSLSPRSRPVILEYDYRTNRAISVELEDGQRPGIKVAPSAVPTETTGASLAAPQGVQGGQVSAPDPIAEAKARLAKVEEQLHGGRKFT
jgi:hypothetical protein